MTIPADYAPRSYFSRRIMSTRAQGLKKGEARGLEKGLEKGLEEGEARGLAKAIGIILAGRGVHLSSEQTRVVTNCSDLDQLQRWLVQAQSVGTADELFVHD